MKKYRQLILFCMALLLGVYSFLPANAEAANLEWTTTNLYYERDTENNIQPILVIEGYFSNNTERYINLIYEMNLTVKLVSNAGYSREVKAVFNNIEKMIDPYSASSHTLRITDVDVVYPLQSYKVTQGYTKWKHSGAAG